MHRLNTGTAIDNDKEKAVPAGKEIFQP